MKLLTFVFVLNVIYLCFSLSLRGYKRNGNNKCGNNSWFLTSVFVDDRMFFCFSYRNIKSPQNVSGMFGLNEILMMIYKIPLVSSWFLSIFSHFSNFEVEIRFETSSGTPLTKIELIFECVPFLQRLKSLKTTFVHTETSKI